MPQRESETAKRRPEHFAALPMRALADKRVKRTHLSVLGAISYFDRFGRNGAGCYATQETIAVLAGCTATTVSKRISDLIKWRYVSGSRQDNRRRMQYRVIHDTCPPGQISRNQSASAGQVSNPDSCSGDQTKRFPEGVLKYPGRNPMRNPPHPSKTEAPERAAKSFPRLPQPPDGESSTPESEYWRFLSQVKRDIRDGRLLSRPELETVDTVFTQLIEDDPQDRGLEMAFEDLLSAIDEKCR